MRANSIINLQADPELKALARRVANRDGLSVSAWVRHQIIKEARRAGLVPDAGRQAGTEERRYVQ